MFLVCVKIKQKTQTCPRCVGNDKVLNAAKAMALNPSIPFSAGGFLRNSRKYGLGSMGKTPTEGIPPVFPGTTSGQLDLSLQPQPTIFCRK